VSVSEIRRYERIDIELPCRLYVPGDDGLRFEAHCTSLDLGLGGVFVSSSFLLRPGLGLFVELRLPRGPLAVRARVVHVVQHDDPALATGMGLAFEDVDAAGRETLLRFFAPSTYATFHEGLLAEFPHLGERLPLEDVALILNLWEEWKVRVAGGPLSTASGAPPAPARGAVAPSSARARR
jgi:hypothetical protein